MFVSFLTLSFILEFSSTIDEIKKKMSYYDLGTIILLFIYSEI